MKLKHWKILDDHMVNRRPSPYVDLHMGEYALCATLWPNGTIDLCTETGGSPGVAYLFDRGRSAAAWKELIDECELVMNKYWPKTDPNGS